MSDYTEHLISMAGGDGEPDLDAIQARWDLAQRTLANDPNIVSIMQLHRLSESADDVPALIALVRSQYAQIERVRELHTPFTHHFLTPPAGSLEVCHSCHESYPCPTIAALTATEGAG